MCFGSCNCTFTCGHSFCMDCTKQWYTNSDAPTCPMCRADINFKGLHKVRPEWEHENIVKRYEDVYSEMIDTIFDEVPVKYVRDEIIELDKTYYKMIELRDLYGPCSTDELRFILEASINGENMCFNSNNGYIYDDFDTFCAHKSIFVSNYPQWQGRSLGLRVGS